MLQSGRSITLNEDEALKLIEDLSNGLRLAKRRIGEYAVSRFPCILNERGENFASDISFIIERELKT